MKPTGTVAWCRTSPRPCFEREPDVSPALRARLLRHGFIQIGRSGLGAQDLYVMAGDVAGVASDTVRLAVPRDQIPSED